METRLTPRKETLPHSHPVEAAVIFLTDADLRITNDDGTVQDETIEQGTVAFGASAIVHRAGNIGNNTARVVTVEVFSQPPPTTMTAAQGEPLLENDKVRIARLLVQPNDSMTIHTATPSVIVAENPGVVATAGARASLRTGGARWCEPGEIKLINDSDTEFEAVIVILKPRA